jgi:hypothetical protein
MTIIISSYTKNRYLEDLWCVHVFWVAYIDATRTSSAPIQPRIANFIISHQLRVASNTGFW